MDKSTRLGDAMRIGIEGKVLGWHGSGIGRYATSLTRALLREAVGRDKDCTFVIFTGPQTSQDALKGCQGAYYQHDVPFKSSLLRSLISLPLALRREHIDVLHGLDHIGIPLVGRYSRYVATIHHVIPLLFPHLFTVKHRWVIRVALARIAQQAERIIVPSHAVREDVEHYLRVPTDRLVVIPEGCDPRFVPTTDFSRLSQVQRRYSLPAQYILFLGTLEPRKNLPTLLQAFAYLWQRKAIDPAWRLVLAGARGWREESIFRTIKSLKLEDAVCLPGFIAEQDLPDVYRGAALFVFPSLYEGFGLPVVEAMGSGVPVITSNTSALPEVAGDAALLIDPHDVDSLAEAMQQMLRDEDLRAHLREKGLKQVQKFSWEVAARRTLELYVDIGNQ